MTTQNDQGASAPYAPVKGDEFFLLCGVPVPFDDQVEPHGFIEQASVRRYVEEVKLIQRALGVEPDGIIGQETRRAARDLRRRIPEYVVRDAFVTLWMDALFLGQEACAANMPPVVRQVTSYFHDLLCSTFSKLKGEEGLLNPTKRPVFIPPVPTPVDRAAEAFSATARSADEATKSFVDLGTALLTLENQRLRSVLEWMIANPTHISQQGRRKIETALSGES